VVMAADRHAAPGSETAIAERICHAHKARGSACAGGARRRQQ
jgi:hypothetical protein